jgi:hypothetical protein
MFYSILYTAEIPSPYQTKWCYSSLQASQGVAEQGYFIKIIVTYVLYMWHRIPNLFSNLLMKQ